MTISLPPAMVKEFENVRRAESRTRSELVREALRMYFASRYPVVTPSKAELAAIRRGRAAFARGDFVSLGELLDGLEPASHRSGTKRPPKAAAKRSSPR
jgi:predicted transcriptional regulator